MSGATSRWVSWDRDTPCIVLPRTQEEVSLWAPGGDRPLPPLLQGLTGRPPGTLGVYIQVLEWWQQAWEWVGGGRVDKDMSGEKKEGEGIVWYCMVYY